MGANPAAITICVMLSLVLASVGPTTAFAHDELLGTTPAAGSVVTGPVPEIALSFGGRIVPQFVTVAVSVDEQPWRQLDVRVDQTTVVAIPYPAAAPSKTTVRQEWRVAYRVVSADGHPISGQLNFIVMPATQQSTSTGPQHSSAPSPGDPEPPGSPVLGPMARTGTVLVTILVLAVLAAGAAIVLWTRRRPGGRA